MKLNMILAAVALSFTIQDAVQANAFVYSILDIQNLRWTVDGTGEISNAEGTNNASVLARLDTLQYNTSITEPIEALKGAFLYACAGQGCDPGTPDELFSQAILDLPGNDSNNLFAGADAVTGSQLFDINRASTAKSSATLVTNITFDFSFTGNKPVATTLSFDYIAFEEALLIDPVIASSRLARAEMIWDLSLQNVTTGEIVNWTPDELNHIIAADVMNPTASFASGGQLSYKTDLKDRNKYRLTITHQSITSTSTKVPEPSVLALMGIGLLGLKLQKIKNRKIVS